MRGASLQKFILVLLMGVSPGAIAHARIPTSGSGAAVRACTLQFKQTNYTTGANPQTIVVGDFNKDGNLDFAQVNYNGGGSGSVDIYLGDGNGRFQKEPNVFATGNGPDALAMADLNGDGNLDLVVGDDTQAAVSVLLGNGDGTFQAHQNYTAGQFPHWVAVADFNGDKKQDIAVANEGGDTVGVLLNNGDGIFGAMKAFATGKEPYSVAAADINQDGKADLAVTGYYASVISILLGNGDGTFGNHKDQITGTAPAVVVAGDFNRDRKIDLATANYNNGQTGSVSVLLGNGDGSFQGHADYSVGAGPDGLALGNFNGDRFSDLAVANLIGGTMSVLPGNGDGTFGPSKDFSTGKYPLGVAVGQFHGGSEKKQDILITNDLNKTVTVFRNKTTCN